MKFKHLLILPILITGFPVLAGDTTGVDRLSWLTGCWAATGAEPGNVETWTRPAGGSLIGMNRSVRGGETVFFEFMLIKSTQDDSLVFIAMPLGESMTEFQMASISDDEVVFENYSHDFPNRIIYRRVSDSEILGRIEGGSGENTSAVDFPMTRTTCNDD